jgi:tetratricopeptide (TPR) repeat protein
MALITPKVPRTELQLSKLIQQGLALHLEGELSEARKLYEQVLEFQPNHFDALQLLGTIAGQTKDFQKALELLSKALVINPHHILSHYNLGKALQELQRYREALISYDRAIAINPNYAEAHSNRGSVLHELKRFEEALVSYKKAYTINPELSALNHHNIGLSLQELKRHDEALMSYDRAIVINPNYAEAHSNRGNVLHELERFEEALISYNNAITINPEQSAQTNHNVGLTLQKLKRYPEAILYYELAIKNQSDFVDAYISHGDILHELKRFEEALVSYQNALNFKPKFAEVYCAIGDTLNELKRFDDALISYDRAIAFKPEYAEAHGKRGYILINEFKRLEDGLSNYDQAIDLKPDYVKVIYNRAVCLQELKRYDEAIAGYQKAIAIHPDYTEAHWNLSLVQLLLGNFNEGWLEYEWRSKSEEVNLFAGIRSFDQPLWLGKEPLKDKTILLYAEQGLGDTLQFCRYVPLVSALGAKVILEVHPSLVPLLYDLDGVSQIIAKDSKLPEFDYQCPLLSLPLAFKTTLETIPSSPSYITSNQNKVAIWQAQLGEKTKPRIGLVWSGSTTHKNDHNRSLTLARLLPYLSPSYEYISLQKEVRDIDQELLNKCEIIKQFGDQLQDFTDTAALCGLMDLVISVDSSVAHLAAAMGISTWVLLPYNPDWRWLLNRDDSPWYHSVKLYRQPLVDDWNSVLEKIQADKNFLLPSK